MSATRTPRRTGASRSYQRAFPIHAVLTPTILLAALATPRPAHAQWLPQHTAATASLRGLSVVNDSVVWASGARGTFLWTADAGAHWTVATVPGAGSLDFRDVHAASLDTAWVMAAAQDTARIYRTSDRGAHWTLQYSDTRRGVFLDAIAFFDARRGLALGDPIAGRFVLLRTADGGSHWEQADTLGLPTALPGEAAFAASGTSLVTCGAHTAWFATGGGRVARVFVTRDAGATWTAHDTPVRAGDAAAGIFSLACRDSLHGVAVGGNYARPDSAAITVASTSDGGVTWAASPPSAATAYLSGVTYLAGGPGVLAVGTRGTSMSHDWGHDWVRQDTLALNAVAAAPGGRVWGVGPAGRVVLRPGAAVVALRRASCEPRGPVTSTESERCRSSSGGSSSVSSPGGRRARS